MLKARVAIAAVAVGLLTGMMVTSPAAAAGKSPPIAQASVVGGQPATLADWGFTVGVASRKGLCSGSVIAPTKVLTAAHCIRGSVTELRVFANQTRLSLVGGEQLGVTSVAINPAWVRMSNDLAVLTLSSPTTAVPVPLGSPADDAAYTGFGAPLYVAGFGTRNPLLIGKPRVGSLMTAQLFVKGGCGRQTSPLITICAAGRRFGTAFNGRKRRPLLGSGCFGDSGGPLVARTPSGPRLVGVVEGGGLAKRGSSFEFVACGLKGISGQYTRVAPNLGFIQGSL